MNQSHIVEVNGAFVGAAITTATGFRFRAVHIKVDELDESAWRSLDDLTRAVRQLYTTGRLSAARPVVVSPLESAARTLLRASSVGDASWMG